MIVGLIKPNEGQIFLQDDQGRVSELTNEPVYRRAQMGVMQTAAGITAAVFFGLLNALIFRPKAK